MVQRIWESINPIRNVTEPGLACNNPGVAPPSYIPIAAGDNLTAVYWYWLHPVGPMSVWLADCGESCVDVDVNKLDFFKIWEGGRKLCSRSPSLPCPAMSYQPPTPKTSFLV